MDEQFAYRTGRTAPAKSSRGIIAALLILVIFLGGMVSILGFLNIRLFRQLKHTQAAPLSFVRGEAIQARGDCYLIAGMALQEPDPVYAQLHDLPQGLYVAQVAPGSQADALGIQPGDMILSLDDTPVSTLEDLKVHIYGRSAFRLSLWRNGREILFRVTQ